MVGEIVSGTVGAIGALGGLFGGAKSNKEIEKLKKMIPEYEANPLAAQRLGLAQQQLQGRMPGAQQAEQNIYQQTANQMSMAQRGATDASQLLATGGAIGGQANQAFTGLSQAEAGDYQRRYGNLTSAQEGQIAEQDKVFQSKMNKYQTLAQLGGAQAQNRSNAWSSIGNLGQAGLTAFAGSGKS